MRISNFFNSSPAFFISLMMLAFLSGCEDSAISHDSNSDSEDIEKKKATDSLKENEIFVLNAHAASSGNQSETWSFLDNNENTIWVSNPGTGQGEYIEINFVPTIENYVEKVNIQTQSGGKITRILKVTLDVNGKYFGVFNPNKDIPIRKNLSSLKIHFSYVEGLTEELKKIDGKNRILQHSPGSKMVGVTDIVFKGRADEILNIRNIQNYNGTIEAVSTIETDNYAEENLFDGKQGTGWATGTEGAEIGQFIRLSFSGKVPASSMIFYNGDQRSQEHFKSNARVKSFSVKTENQQPQIFNLKDETGPQLLRFEPALSGEKYELEILEIYKGEEYKKLVISELCFLRKDNQSWRVNSNEDLKKSDFSINTVLGNIIDRFVSCTTESGENINTQKLILRSDNSFDLHSIEEKGSGDAKVWHSSGFWEKISDKKLKLHGGIEVEGETKSSSFSEIITIHSNYIQGNKFFDKIYLD